MSLNRKIFIIIQLLTFSAFVFNISNAKAVNEPNTEVMEELLISTMHSNIKSAIEERYGGFRQFESVNISKVVKESLPEVSEELKQGFRFLIELELIVLVDSKRKDLFKVKLSKENNDYFLLENEILKKDI
jgi:hypothetical protein